jgi:Raf kinase inhibitor-like YbhB/YbcL family protein
MKLASTSISNGAPIPPACAAGVPGRDGPQVGPNRSPHLAWSDVPAGTRSFAVICHDRDVPSKADDVNRADRTVPYDLPRVAFHHWVLVDVPASTTELRLGADSESFTPGGKPPGPTPNGVRGVNDYTAWFANDPAMRGDYGGYDGPWPPFNDERLHHYVFTVYALDVASLGLPARFDGPAALRAMEGHVLAKAELIGTYSLHPNPRP